MFEKIRDVLVETLNVDADLITPEASLKDDLGIDSLAAVELSLELESNFDIKIEDEELVQLKTVGDIEKLLAGK
ncbi:acyl carrier protein [Anaerorhabdus furcosa]|uniref:Acyl carrier protein n=1 Tax=Anaerorhabdus furcosa TaxID=118967 RepID=A0A1T4KPP7_9FIRM|nr:acyl carrier protein [Anaerorhabdus furcosa]SJZ44386.1 acyl carrier protein [Anaerorhabdus furcosa]